MQTRWRVCKLFTPSSSHDLGIRVLDLNEFHPLLPDTLLQKTSNESTTSSETHPLSSSVSQQQQEEDELIEQSIDDQEKLRSSSSAEIILLKDGELDPLGAMGMMSLEDGNGLTLMSESQRSNNFRDTLSVQGKKSEEIKKKTIKQSWKEHKDRVLAKFADQKFKIKASMLEASILENEIAWTPKYEYQQEKDDNIDTKGIGVIKKTRARLEQLEKPKTDGASSSSVKEEATIEMSQSEYIDKIQGMQKELISMWNQGQKVISLKIAIKCVKLLGDLSSPQLYPCVYVLVSDVLDCFGELVFERIKQRASEDDNGMPLSVALPENFTSAEVNIHAKETCRNWFYKTACIRELLPRIYIEIALLKCYRFLCDNEYAQIVLRLSNMIKGVGEPMVALYTNLYLSLTSSELLQTQEKTATLSSLFDYFFIFHHFQLHKLERFLLKNEMSQSDYLALHSPAVEWLMKHLAQDATQEIFETILGHYQQFSDNSMVLKHLCECFDGKFYIQKPLEMLHLIRVSSSSSNFSKCHLYSVLALQLALTLSDIASDKIPPKDQWILFLNEAWTLVTLQENILQYMECAAAYMKLIIVKFSYREALILLKDVVSHLNSLTEEQLTPKVYGFLGALIENVVTCGAQKHLSFLTRVIPSSEFLMLMGMFKREASVSVAKKILRAFINPLATTEKHGNRDRTQKIRLRVCGPGATVTHTLFVICCRVHDALDTLSTICERQEAAKDICSFIYLLGNHPEEDIEEEEALLMFYIDCRSAFYKLESVKVTLSMQVLALAMRVAQRCSLIAKSELTVDQALAVQTERLNLIKSCLAYAHITIPSLTDVCQKLQLMILSAKVALVNNCLPQLDAFIKNTIIFISEIDPSNIIAATTSTFGGSTTFGTNTGESNWDFQSQLENSQKDYRGGVSDSSSLVGGGGGGGIVDFYEEYFNQIPEFAIVWFVCELVSIMVYTPSCMENDPFYFINGLRKAVVTEEMTFKWKIKENKLIVLRAFIQLCALWGQDKIPKKNGFLQVESNDILYGGDENFQVEVNQVFSETIELILQEIENLSSSSSALSLNDDEMDTFGLQMELMLDFINQIVPCLSLAQHEEENNKENNTTTGTVPSSMSLGIFLLQKCAIFVNQKAFAYTQAFKNSTNNHRHTRQQEQLYTSRQEYLASTKSFLQMFAKEKAIQIVNADSVSTLATLFGE